MNNWLLTFFCLLGLAFLAGCANEKHAKRQEAFSKWTENNGKIKVLSTTAMINDLVQGVGKEHVDALTLIQGGLDPHSYQLVKGDDEKLMYAQVIFYNGLGLEHGPSLKRYLNDNSKAFALGDGVEKQGNAFIIYVNGQKDPHIWMDISLWSKTVPLIVEHLSRQDPAHAEVFQSNAEELLREMAQVHEEVKRMMHEVPSKKRYLVTSHDAFNYFARAYLSEESEYENGEWSKRFAAPEGLAPESQLSALDIKTIIDYLDTHQITLVFPESNVSRDSIRKIIQAGQKKGLNVQMASCVLYGDAMGPPGSEADTYLKMIHCNARALAENMEGKVITMNENVIGL
ncbi:MAG: zinc ABC transporter substrate-binding protein [Candidatus Protochlamydia sp.]|nr:zinc ABC transporter substrate-binding protein [Candidatus Protochlamydia sp.]